MRRSFVLFWLFSSLLLFLTPAAQGFDEASLGDDYAFRSIGPYRGGRSCAVTGVAGDPATWYFGSTGGGVWKSTNAGESWNNVSDGFFGGSIGAIAVAPSDPNVVYVGGGEKTVRGNVSHGHGMWRSTDAGRSWAPIGLTDSRHIGRIRVHPADPDLVYVAVMGHLFGPNDERGLFRSRDGGRTWEKILFVDENVGCVDLAMDPGNSRVLYASFWRIRRTPYSLESGGEGSSMWKSTDGGDSWSEITRNEGLPKGVIGINAMTVSPLDSDRIWAILEAEDGGVFRSDDAGGTWRRVNSERSLRQRAWYYTRIYADTGDVDTVYVLNVRFWKSKDGGKSFDSIRTPHGDHHDLWIDPERPRSMIVGDDGGAQVSLDGGESFTTYHNQPTAQFYRVTVDNSFPYRIYGAQQDNSTVRIRHRSDSGSITAFDWEPTAGGESGWLAPDPRDPEIVYGGSYGGYLTRTDHRVGAERIVNVWPDNPMGHGAEGMEPRFQWNFPILFSRHEPGLLYTAGNRLYASRDEGHSWTALSGDLTRNDPSRLGPSGGPITKDNTGVEYYCTIFALAEDCFEQGVIWTGSDDGLVHLTRDGGATWTNVSPKGLPDWAQINAIEADPHRPGSAYVAATRYKSDDFAPYLFHTVDYGRTWKKIVAGIAPDHFTRVVRADPERQGLLYAGTESGLYVSFDDGRHWETFQLNLPLVPVTDLIVKDRDLVVATQGRSFWVLDDLSVLHEWSPSLLEEPVHLFTPRSTWRVSAMGRWGDGGPGGENHPDGVLIHYRFAEKPDSSTVQLVVLDDHGQELRRFRADDAKTPLPAEAGLNRFVWDLHLDPAEEFDGMILWAGRLVGPRVVPGHYRLRLECGDRVEEASFELRQDPRSPATPDELVAQFDFLLAIRDRLSEIHRAIEEMRDVRSQIAAVQDRAEGTPASEVLEELASPLLETMKDVEESLYQTKNQSRQDPLNFPIRLNNKLAALAGTVAVGDYAPTEQARSVHDDLDSRILELLGRWHAVRDEGLDGFNARVLELKVPAVRLEAATESE